MGCWAFFDGRRDGLEQGHVDFGFHLNGLDVGLYLGLGHLDLGLLQLDLRKLGLDDRIDFGRIGHLDLEEAEVAEAYWGSMRTVCS